MQTTDRVFVAGHRGLVGSALVRCLARLGYQNVVTRTHDELDLTCQPDVVRFFQDEKPDHVFLAAAKVGGIHANNTFPAEFIQENLAIQTNVLRQAHLHGVKRLLFLGSSCIYPRDCAQPIKEEYLMTGPLEATNRPYAVAKIAGVETCWALNRQYETTFLAVMPTNLYGLGDNYDLEGSHVLPALIRKFHEAKIKGEDSVTAWGTGRPRREFLFSEDLADACVFLMSLDDTTFSSLLSEDRAPLVNIGCGHDLEIRELVELVKSAIGFEGEVMWDTSQPDGTPRKLLDVSRLTSLGWRPQVEIVEGIGLAYRDYLGQVGSPFNDG